MKRNPFTAFDYANYAFMLVLVFLTLYPFWYILVVSFATPEAYYTSRYNLIPTSFTLDSYRYNFANPQVYRSFVMSVSVAGLGTLTSLLLTSMTGYFLSKSDIKGRNLIFRLFIITMFIGGGLIPFYVLIIRLGMRNTIFALFVPQSINTFFLILMKNYFVSMPASLEESAKLDGANEFLILFRIILPVATPIVATIALFYSVQYWNDWFWPMIFISNRRLFPLSLYLRNLISEATGQIDVGVVDHTNPTTVRAAVIIITITPIIMVYPFLQKYFVRGIMLGAIKG